MVALGRTSVMVKMVAVAKVQEMKSGSDGSVGNNNVCGNGVGDYSCTRDGSVGVVHMCW